MTDLEMLQLCARAMGFKSVVVAGTQPKTGKEFVWVSTNGNRRGEHAFDPLHDYAQAFGLVIKMKLSLGPPDGEGGWCAWDNEANISDELQVEDEDPCRAIVECVARLQRLREKKHEAALLRPG